MAVVKVINKDYTSSNTLTNLHQYIIDDCKTAGLIGGIAVDVLDAPYQMQKLKTAYHKTDGRQVIHIVVSFDKREMVTASGCLWLAPQIAEFFANEFQTVYGIHQNTSSVHIHYMLNSVSYLDGHKFHWDYGDLNDFKLYVNNLVLLDR